MNKHLILIRHAHRDVEQGRELDNGLSEKGWKQVKRITDYLLAYRNWEQPMGLVSSPKLRCQETLAQLSKKLMIPTRIDSRLDELEDADDRRKIGSFTKDWQKGLERTLVACSHGDWIPLFLSIHFGLHLPLRKSGFVIAEYEEDRLEIDSIVQKVL